MTTTPTRTTPTTTPQVTPAPERYNPGTTHCPSQRNRTVRRVRRFLTPGDQGC